MDAPDKTVTVSGTASNTEGVAGPADVALAITDDDGAGVSIAPTSVTVTEASGADQTETYTVELDSAPTANVTLTPASSDTAAATVSGALTFTTSNWSTEQMVTVTGVDDTIDNPGDRREVVVRHTATSADTNYNGISVTSVDVTVTDDDENMAPEVSRTLAAQRLCVGETVELVLTNYFTDPDGGQLTYTRSRSGDSALLGLSVSGNRLVLTGQRAGTTTMSVVAVDPGGLMVSQVVDVTVCEGTDDGDGGGGGGSPSSAESAPRVTLILTPTSISEAGGVSTVTATLDKVSGADTTLVVVAEPIAPARAEDVELSADATLRIAAGRRQSTGLVTLTAVDNELDGPDKPVRVTATVMNSEGVRGPTSRTLTIIDDETSMDDDASAQVSLALSPTVISEAGGVSTVTAMLDQALESDTTLVVSVAPLVPAVAEDVELSANVTLVIAAGQRQSTGLVTVTAVDNDIDEPEDRLVRVTGTVTNAQDENGSVSQTLTLTDDDEMGVGVSPTRVTVTEAPGDRHTAGYTVVLTSEPTGPVTLTPVSGDTGIATVSPLSLTFSAGDWDSAQTLTVSGVDDELFNDGERMTGISHTVQGGGYDGVTVESVAVTVEDDEVGNRPPVAAELLMARKLCIGESEELALGAYFSDPDGDALSYSGSRSADSKIVRVSVTGERLTLTPLQAGMTTVSVVAVDPAGLMVSQVVDVTVCGETDEALRERYARVGEALLPRVSQALVAGTLDAVKRRIEGLQDEAPAETSYSLGGQLTAGSSMERTIYEVLKSAEQGLSGQGGGLDWGRLLGNSSFALALDKPGSDGGGLGWLHDVSVWGQGSYRSLSQEDRTDWDGELIGAQVGIDGRVHPQVVAGTALSWHQGWFDWSEGLVSGEYEVEMTGVQPYAGWRSEGGTLGVWGTVGYGWGRIEVENNDICEDEQHSSSTLVSGALGATGELLSREGLLPGDETTLRAKGEVSVVRWDVEGNGLIEPLAVDSRRVRLALELEHDLRIGCVDLTSLLEAGLRYDGGDGENGAGLEVVAGLRYLYPCLGMTFEGRVRTLALSENDYEEWGGEFLLRMDPGPSGTGLALNLTSGYGKAASSIQRLWDEEVTQQLAAGAYRPRARLEAELAYGWPFGGMSLFTPYSRLTWLGEGKLHYRVGGRWNVGRTLELSLTGERRQGSQAMFGSTLDHRILLEGRFGY